MTKITLYGLTKIEVIDLCNYCNNDVAVLGLFLWDKNRASSINRGVFMAKKLIKFSRS